MKYAVIVYYSFESDCSAYLLDDYNKAKEYLHDLWQDNYNEELAANITPIDEIETYHEDDYAQITWIDGDFMQYVLTSVSEPIKINGNSYR